MLSKVHKVVPFEEGKRAVIVREPKKLDAASVVFFNLSGG